MATQVTLNSGSVDSAGSLALKTNGTTTAVTINSSQGVEFNAGTAALPSITTTGDTNTGIFFPAADTIAFSEGGVEAARIDSSGNLGLGVTPSAWGGSYKAFQIQGTGRSLAATGAGAGDLTLAFNAIYDSTDSRWEYANTGDSAVRYSQTGSGIHAWYNAASGTAGNAITFTQAMTLDASGNLGVNATTPSTYGKLVVSGGGFTQLATTALPATSGSTRSDFTRILDSAGSRSLDSSISSTGAWIQSRDKNDYSVNYDLFLQPNGGNVGIGTSSPADRLDIRFASGTGNFKVGVNSGNNIKLYNTVGDISLLSSDPSSDVTLDSQRNILFRTATTERARIDSSGNLLVGTTTTSAGVRLKVVGGIITCLDVYNNTTGSAANMQIDSNGNFARSTSSLKYKEDVQDATHGLAEVMALRPVTYKGKAKTDAGKTFGGLIAEEVHATGLTEFVQYAEDGSPDALAYGNMVSLLTKAIQEQQALITQLTARLDAANL